MDSLNLADTFITFLALFGPQKVLLSFGRLSRTLDDHSVRVVAAATAATAAIIGAVCALTAPWVTTFFHIGAAELDLAAGLLFIIYAVGLVLGIHFDTEPRTRRRRANAAEDDDGGRRPGAPADRAGSGRCCCRSWSARSRSRPTWRSRSRPAAGAADGPWRARSRWSRWWTCSARGCSRRCCAACTTASLEVLSRLLGTLLAAVGVGVFLDGLIALGVVLHGRH